MIIKEIYKNLRLKDYLNLLLLILLKNNKDFIIYNLFLQIYIENSFTNQLKKKFTIFIKEYKMIKGNYNIKKDKIIYNKIKKILFDIKKLLLINTNILNIELIHLHKLNMFMYLPFKTEITIIFKR